MPHRPVDRLRAGLIGSASLLALCATPALAHAGTLIVTFTGTVSVAFGDLGTLSGGETITGTIELDDTVVGTFTPVTVFTRAEMLYTDAVLGMSLVVDGNPVSGTGGDLEVLDSDGPLNGDDSYEATGVIDTGTVGGAVPVSFFFNSAYDDPVFTLTPTTPLFAPPPIDPASANQFLLTSATGGSAFGQIDSFSVGGAPSVPVPGVTPVGFGLTAAALASIGALRARVRSRRAEG